MTREITLRGKGLKYDQDKPRWGLLPWAELEAVVRILTFGAKKYAPGNWKLVKGGQQRYFDAALRHIAALGRGEAKDPETGESHYAHAICSLLFSFWHSRKDKETLR